MGCQGTPVPLCPLPPAARPWYHAAMSSLARWQWVLAIAAAVVLWAAGLLALPPSAPAPPPPGTFELWPPNVALFRLVNSYRSPLADAVSIVFIALGTGWVLLPALILAWLARPRRVVPLLLAAGVEAVTTLALKLLFAQPRPFTVLPGVHVLQPLVRNYAFPSGDVGLATALAVVLGWHARWQIKLALGLYVFLVAYGRLYAGVHFPIDVLMGVLVGMATGTFAVYVWQRGWLPRVPHAG